MRSVAATASCAALITSSHRDALLATGRIQDRAECTAPRPKSTNALGPRLLSANAPFHRPRSPPGHKRSAHSRGNLADFLHSIGPQLELYSVFAHSSDA